MNRPTRLGVGIVGCGQAAQAIHLPVLAELSGLFRVACLLDPDRERVETLGSHLGVPWTTSLEELLDDPAVDVVAICGPDALHVEHVEAACRAGKRLVFCEKPLGNTASDISRVENVYAETGVPIVVGAMHGFDPAFRAAVDAWRPQEVLLVRSTAYLPPNAGFIAQATNLIGATNALVSSAPDDPGARVKLLIDRFLVHHIPLIRRFIPTIDSVVAVQPIDPFGFLLITQGGSTFAQASLVTHGHWGVEWVLEAIGVEQELRVSFPPSYVRSGSAEAAVRSGAMTQSWRFPESGYEEQWREISRLATQRAGRAAAVTRAALADMRYRNELTDLVALGLS